MENDHQFRVLSVNSVQPISGWWLEERLEPMDDDDKLEINFHPVFGVASISVELASGKETNLSLLVTLSELTQMNYNVLTGQGTTEISKQFRVFRHDIDFEILGVKLKENAENRGEI